MRLTPRSLAMRVVAFSTLWAAIALIGVGTVIAAFYRSASDRNFNNLLSAHLFNLIATVGLDGEGNLEGAPDFGDIRYAEPGSGWYWSVEPIDGSVKAPLRSGSMTADVAAPPPADAPFDKDFRRRYIANGQEGEKLRVVESEYLLGDRATPVRFRLMGNESEFQGDLSAFNRTLFLYLGLFGLGMIAINAVAIRIGFRPLDRVRGALAEVREGKADRLAGAFPREIEPLTNEMNALIDNNRRIVERSRVQVGNLAHSLKTPLSVMRNEGDALGGSRGQLIVNEADAMRRQIDHYLQRARMAAQHGGVVFRTEAGPALDRMVRVMAKLNPDKQVEWRRGGYAPVFAGEQQDLEEIAGNLLENAMKWAKGKVAVRLTPAGEGSFRLQIGDDGPGIPDDKRDEALKRGRRLDEKVAGTGLGLSIVAELVQEYGGALELGRSDLGGLLVSVTLPEAAK